MKFKKRILTRKVQYFLRFFVDEEAESNWVKLARFLALVVPELTDEILAFDRVFLWLPDGDGIEDDGNDGQMIAGVDGELMDDDWILIDTMLLFLISFITLHDLTAFKCL